MSLIPTVYSSADPGAPVLTGQPGSLLALLRAILVTGYGVAPNLKPGLGWTEEFSGTNKAVFRNSPITGTGYYVRVTDDGTAAAGGSSRSASLTAYSSMTSIDSGLDATPSIASAPNGALWAKSGAANDTARPWWAIGNERALYLFLSTHGATLSEAVPNFVGDLVSLKPADMHCFAVSINGMSSWAGSGYDVTSKLFYTTVNWNSGGSAAQSALSIGRGHAGASGPVNATLTQPPTLQSPLGGGAGLPFPYPVNNGMLLDRVSVLEGPQLVRGFMPGLYSPFHVRPFADLVTVTDPAGMPPGTALLAKRYRTYYAGDASYEGQVLFNTGAW